MAGVRKDEQSMGHARSSKGGKPTKTSRLRRGERGERLAIYVPPGLAEALRVRCAKERRSVSDAVTEAVCSWMGIALPVPAASR